MMMMMMMMMIMMIIINERISRETYSVALNKCKYKDTKHMHIRPKTADWKLQLHISISLQFDKNAN